MPEKSRDSLAVVYKNPKDGSLAWDELPAGINAQQAIDERTQQGFVPITTTTKEEAIRQVNNTNTSKDVSERHPETEYWRR